jgi:hypothetical protein
MEELISTEAEDYDFEKVKLSLSRAGRHTGGEAE